MIERHEEEMQRICKRLYESMDIGGDAAGDASNSESGGEDEEDSKEVKALKVCDSAHLLLIFLIYCFPTINRYSVLQSSLKATGSWRTGRLWVLAVATPSQRRPNVLLLRITRSI